jgi:uncharacterized protein YecT (DUF1311 family)
MGISLMRMLIVLAMLFFASAAMAQSGACSNAQDQMTLNECAGQSFRKSDNELNTLYKQIQQRLKGDADTTKLLVAAQRAWLSFRDAECAFVSSSVSGGSIYPMIHAICADRLTQKRITDFKAYLTCEDGDMSCPVPAQL